MAEEKKLGLFALIALVIGSMIGGGAFNLASDMASGAGAGAILIGWIITGVGMIALAFSFQNLTTKRPDLDGGIFTYAREGFGHFMGFNSGWGYWFAALLGNVAYGTLLFSAIGYFIPAFGDGQNIASIIGASVILWCVHFLILRGVQSAAMINLITTISKLVPIFAFIIAIIFVFHLDLFTNDFWGKGLSLGSIGTQVKSTMLVTVWVFTGIEGAVLFSSRAKKSSDVGKATVIGLISVLVIYVMITMLSLGVMNQQNLAELPNPSMAAIMEHIVGKWGAVLINLGLIISVLGAWLAWTLFAGELPLIAAREGVFPKWFGKENKNGAPTNALTLTNAIIQLFLLTFLISDAAYQFAFSLASSAILIPYLFSGLYQLKYSWLHKEPNRGKNLIIGIIASLYGVWLVYAAGLDYLLLTMILYAPGILVFRAVRKGKEGPVFNKAELLIAALILVLAVIAVIRLASGSISI
ncbi:arginine-ornithine antiporter [Bacillus licheniformis]|uniref:arginine-ornithine antiporter n=1 Tax=Bacillus licheniformis TaxID=1402 RepID=UPI0011A2B435|nr:arginine-ornithine antiporter [Bacillus licheniformis]MCM3211130.1 arginine-ornithine antiporter [Bacillus licheniformis]MCM3286736.1 arginine-ornithine antiporter [Bacillus licheniformis]TWK04045.1 putative arginine/ornithine antiporter [Bacillus licheniformis]